MKHTSHNSPCVPNPGRGYSGARKAVDNLISFSARITTQQTILPCEPNATFSAHSVAWVGVTTADISKWAQMGYARHRLSGSAIVGFHRYCEVCADWEALQDGDMTVYDRSWFSAPVAVAQTYQGQLNQSNRRWEFTCDGAALHHWANVNWIGETGERVDYTAEIIDLNSRMLGTLHNRCRFEHCRYSVVGGGFVNASTARRKSGPPSEGFILGPLPASLRARPIHRTSRESETYKGRRLSPPPLEGELEGVNNFCRNALDLPPLTCSVRTAPDGKTSLSIRRQSRFGM
jgi:hypothetical protein